MIFSTAKTIVDLTVFLEVQDNVSTTMITQSRWQPAGSEISKLVEEVVRDRSS